MRPINWEIWGWTTNPFKIDNSTNWIPFIAAFSGISILLLDTLLKYVSTLFYPKFTCLLMECSFCYSFPCVCIIGRFIKCFNIGYPSSTGAMPIESIKSFCANWFAFTPQSKSELYWIYRPWIQIYSYMLKLQFNIIYFLCGAVGSWVQQKLIVYSS